MGIYAWREAPCWSCQSHAFVREVRGHAPTRKFKKKWCNLVRFGVYFAAILSKKFAKMFILYTKVIDIVLLGTIFRGIAAYSPECVFIVLKTGSPAWGQSRLLGLPLKKNVFPLWGGGGRFLHVRTILLIFASLTFSLCLPHPPSPYENFCPPLRAVV